MLAIMVIKAFPISCQLRKDIYKKTIQHRRITGFNVFSVTKVFSISHNKNDGLSYMARIEQSHYMIIT